MSLAYDNASYYVAEEREWLNYGFKVAKLKGVYKPQYTQLLEQLHETTFIFVIPSDRNRAGDGLYMRHVLNYRFDGRDCSVLEMLIAFSERAYREYFAGYVDSVSDMFWRLIDNLELTEYDNYLYDSNEYLAERYVAAKLDTWLNRRFSYDGTGSIFPLKCPTKDQRTLEIWSQMNKYIAEM